MMNSDDERDVDIDSDEERRAGGGKHLDKRAHHNALERKRRDHIKESFSSLRDSIPTMKGDKSSRAQILKNASEYINYMRQKQNNHSRDVDDLRRQNEHIERQIKALEKAKTQGTFSSAQEVLSSSGLDYEVAGPDETREEVTFVEQTGSGSDSNDSNNTGTPTTLARGITVVQTAQLANTRTTTVTVQPAPAATGGASARPIQPGQSLLIMSSNTTEPAKKKFKQ